MINYNTITPSLKQVLKQLMQLPMLDSFRLAGDTTLGIQLGHRQSAAIDLFTDEMYSSINFQAIDTSLKSTFENITWSEGIMAGMGRTYHITIDKETIKTDVFYATEKFIRPALVEDGIRIATLEDMIAMKLELISGAGRKMDFWDLHELTNHYSLLKMLAFHKEAYPNHHDPKLITQHITFFEKADQDFDPICLRGKHWELIKLDLMEFVKGSV